MCPANLQHREENQLARPVRSRRPSQATRQIICDVLIKAEQRIIKSHEPFWILAQLIHEFFEQWSWPDFDYEEVP